MTARTRHLITCGSFIAACAGLLAGLAFWIMGA